MSQNPQLNPFYNILKHYNPSYLSNHQHKLKQFGVNNITHYFQPPMAQHHPMYGMPKFNDFTKLPYAFDPNYYQYAKYRQFYHPYEQPIEFSQKFIAIEQKKEKKLEKKSAIIVISDDQDDVVSTIPSNKQQKTIKAPKVVSKAIQSKRTLIKDIKSECLNLQQLKNDEPFYIKKMVPKNKKIKKQSIKLISQEQRKSIRKNKEKTRTNHVDKVQRIKYQQSIGCTKIGKQFQSFIPELIIDVQEKQIWIHSKKIDIMQRIIKQY